jgi:hypothetical protein
MSARTDLERRIEKEKQKVADLRSQTERLEAFIQGLQEALKILPRDGEKETRRASKAKTTTTFKPGSDVEKAYKFLRQAAKTMHISEILVGIGEEDTKANRLSLSSSLSRYVRKNQVFTRPRPNSFALKESMDTRVTPTPLLPPEFGAET